MNKDIPITFELLEKLKSPRGGYSRLALESLGIKWPPPKGWRKELIRQAKQNHVAQGFRSSSKWSDHKPITAGFYWWRFDKNSAPGIVEASAMRDDLYIDGGKLGEGPVSTWTGQWSGPIEKPQD